MPNNLQRLDPFLSQRFMVEIDGLVVAGFSDVSGLQAETEFEEIREGGVNDFVYKLPKGTKYQNLTLKKGLTTSSSLWDWHRSIVAGKITFKTVRIILQNAEADWDHDNQYQLIRAYPVKWSGPELKADGNAVAVETLELAHHGIKRGK